MKKSWKTHAKNSNRLQKENRSKEIINPTEVQPHSFSPFWQNLVDRWCSYSEMKGGDGSHGNACTLSGFVLKWSKLYTKVIQISLILQTGWEHSELPLILISSWVATRIFKGSSHLFHSLLPFENNIWALYLGTLLLRFHHPLTRDKIKILQ